MFKGKSFWFTAVLMLVMSMFLVACGGDDTEEADTPEETGEETTEEENGDDTPEKPEELTIWVNDEEQQLDAHEEMVERFEDEYGISVSITPYSMLDQLDGMELDAPAGQGPDLFFQPHDRMGDIDLLGVAAELDLTEDQEERLAGYNEEAVESFSYDGIQYGIPAVVETYGLFYNQQHVDEAPETLDDLMDIAYDITDDENYGFLMNALDLYFVYPFLASEGGYIFGQDADGVYDPSDIGLNTPEAVAGAETIQTWFEDDLIPTGIEQDIIDGLFADGQVAMAINGPWAIPDYRDALGDDLGVAPLPTNNGEHLSSFAGNKGWLVNYYTEDQYWATELALFLTNAENSELYYETAGELPAHLDVEIDDEFMEPIFEQTEHAYPMPNIPEMSQVWEPIGDALEFISSGEDVQEVLDEAVEEIEAEISIMGQ
ncbi:carbohydrate ABC transporter substrate-binding protein, CUT1 family [Pelagirhabdus alkalitolerans]|uniref:Maltodextrin-binding protein n=1 Tax=Pelagirhabdus alkalitolerans TaxID=1612202 RepID=A0A1G6KH18_9BACI|nr:extracellular solute-binding protein [Pelagirhabdus alkalitolerans]SDC29865.1 carbohydrate ABC transporter substrate-binding protein, CUT1 family [Pelagirhabdus alkalitolerans]